MSETSSRFPVELPALLATGRDDLAVMASGLDGRAVEIRVTSGGFPVAEAVFVLLEEGRGCFEEIWVDPAWRRKGIATAVYDSVEALGVEVQPSSTLDEDGALFWEARMARRAVTPR